MKSTAQCDARAVRDALLKRGGPAEDGFVRYAYRPYDTRWLYWEADGPLLDRPRVDYHTQVIDDNLWLEIREKEARPEFSRGTLCRNLADNFGNGLSSFLPLWLLDDGLGLGAGGAQRRPNLSLSAQHYLDSMGAGVEDLFHHVITTLHDPAYRMANVGALRMEWPRIPLPGWPDGVADGAVDALAESAARGRQLAALLDSDTPVAGVTQSTLRTELVAIAVPTTTDGGNMAGDDFAVSVGWGHFGSGGVIVPRPGSRQGARLYRR